MALLFMLTLPKTAVVGVGVAERERRQVPLALDHGEHGGVVVDEMAHVVLLRIRRHHHHRHPEAVTVEAVVLRLADLDQWRDEIRSQRDGRRHLVRVAPVLVVIDDEQRLVPVG